MLEHLWTHEPAPADYLDMVLCRLYGALPSALDKEDGARCLRHLTCLSAETEVVKAI